MHPQARRFTEFAKQIFPEYFLNKKVLDVGSGDINGNNRFLFQNCEYHGNDVIGGRNVTIVSPTKNLPFANETFDTIISTECFEHDPDFSESLSKIYEMLKPSGLFVFTCAGEGRREHGTRRTTPNDSFGTLAGISNMQDYYKNITLTKLTKAMPVNTWYKPWNCYYNSFTKDFYFIGVKDNKKTNNLILLEYKDDYVKKL